MQSELSQRQIIYFTKSGLKMHKNKYLLQLFLLQFSSIARTSPSQEQRIPIQNCFYLE